MAKKAREYSKDSYLALGRIPTDNKKDRECLEGVTRDWLFKLEQAKWPRGLQYFENASYLLGNHLTRFYYTAEGGLGTHTFGVNDSNSFDSLVAKVVDNRLIRPVETVVSMWTQTRPQPRVVPNSDLPDDEDAASLAEIVIKTTFENPLDLPRKLREASYITTICGTAAIEVDYGYTDIPIITDETRVEEQPSLFDDAPLQIPVPTGRETVEMRKEMTAKVWTPFHLTVDPGATNSSDMSWIARTTFEDLDWIKDEFDKKEDGYFPENLEGMATDNATKYILYWWSKMQDILESPQYAQHGGGMTSNSTASLGGFAPNQTTFSVIDVKPTREFPRGRTLIMAGGKLIYSGKARAWSEKYPWRWHGYGFFHWLKIPGKFLAVPLLSEIVPLQKKINAIDALVAANRQYMSIGQWLIPHHSKMAEGRVSGIPGEQYVYKAVAGMPPPERVQHVPLPQELLIEREQLIQSIDHIAASSLIGSDMSKSGLRAGVMLDFLKQEKLSSKAPMIQDFEKGLETVAQNILIEYQLGLEEEDSELSQRIAQAAREHSEYTIQTFTGAALRDHHAVTIDISSEMMHSPEAMQAKALEFFQYSGGQVSPEERDGITRALGLDKFIKNEESMSVKRAKRMISRITKGMFEAAVPMPGIDKATAMAPVFQSEILSDKFNEYDKQVKQTIFALFDHYRTAAEQEIQQQMQQQLMMQQALQSAQKGGGEKK